MRIIYGPVVPEDISAMVGVADDRLQSVGTHLVGDVENYGFVDIMVSPEYSQFGDPQVIEAPQWGYVRSGTAHTRTLSLMCERSRSDQFGAPGRACTLG